MNTTGSSKGGYDLQLSPHSSLLWYKVLPVMQKSFITVPSPISQTQSQSWQSSNKFLADLECLHAQLTTNIRTPKQNKSQQVPFCRTYKNMPTDRFTLLLDVTGTGLIGNRSLFYLLTIFEFT